MFNRYRCRPRPVRLALAAIALCACFALPAIAADPIRIGFSLSPTGPTSPAGKQVLAGLEIWRDDVNAKGGLLGRPVELVYYDDQGNPGERARHLRQADGRRQGRPADRALQHQCDRGGDAGDHPGQPHHDRHFRPRRQQGVQISALLLDELAGSGIPATIRNACSIWPPQQNPKPMRVALIGADVEYSRNALDGARENAKKHGLEIVFERTYPPSTTEFTSIVRAMQAANPDVVFAATLPIDTAGIIRAASEIQFKPKMYRRRNARPAGHRHQAAARADDQRLYQQRVLHSGAEPAVHRHQGDDGRVSEARDGARHRSARLHLSALCLCGGADPREGRDRNQVARRRQARRHISPPTPSTPSSARSRSDRTASGRTPRIICIQFQDVTGGDIASSRTGRGRSWFIRPNSRPAN